jgi:hypothetical protein
MTRRYEALVERFLVHGTGSLAAHRNKMVAEAAYFRWLNRGCPQKQDLEDWFEAERAL